MTVDMEAVPMTAGEERGVRGVRDVGGGVVVDVERGEACGDRIRGESGEQGGGDRAAGGDGGWGGGGESVARSVLARTH